MASTCRVWSVTSWSQKLKTLVPPWFFNEWVELWNWLRWEIIWLQKLEASPFAKSKCPDLEIAGFRWQLDQVSKVPAYGKDSPSWHSSSTKRSSNHHIPIWQCLHLDLVPATARWSPDGNGYFETYVNRRDTLTALSPMVSLKHEDVSWNTCRNINSTLSISFIGIAKKIKLLSPQTFWCRSFFLGRSIGSKLTIL